MADPVLNKTFLAEGLLHLARPISEEQARAHLVALSKACGVDHVIYLSLRTDPNGDSGVFQLTTYDPTWVKRYAAENYQSIDPLLRRAQTGGGPFLWSDLDDETPEVKAFCADAWSHGIGRQGMTVPMLGPDGERALFSVVSNGEEEDWESRIWAMTPYLQIFGWAFHRGMGALRAAESATGPMPSPREIEVLRWAARGKTVKETGLALGLSNQTIEGYIRDAVRCLGCHNKTHAVAVAVRRKLI